MPAEIEELEQKTGQTQKQVLTVTEQKASLAKATRSLEIANLELKRAQKAYDKTAEKLQEDATASYLNTSKEIEDLQKHASDNAARILKLLGKTQTETLNAQAKSILSFFEKSYNPTVLQKMQDDILKRFEERRLGIFKRGTGGFVDRALTRHEDRSQYVKDMKATGQYQGSSTAELKARYDASMALQRKLDAETKKLLGLQNRVGEKAASQSKLFQNVADLTERLREIDSRFVSDSEKQEAETGKLEAPTPINVKDFAPDVAARVEKAQARVDKLNGKNKETPKATENTGPKPKFIEKNKKTPKATENTGPKPEWIHEKAPSKILPATEKNGVMENYLSGILAAATSIDTRLKNHWVTTDVKKQDATAEGLMGTFGGGAVKGIASALTGGVVNFLKGLVGGGTGLASVFGRVAGVAAAGAQLYSSYKNFDKDTKDSEGKRLSLFQHKKGESILDSRAGYYGRNALAGGEIGLQVGSMFGPVGSAIGAGVGALGGLAFTFFQDYHKEIMEKLNSWKTSIGGFFTNVGSGIKNLSASVVDHVTKWKTNAETIYKNSTEELQGLFAKLPDSVKNIGVTLFNLLTGFPKMFWKGMKDAAGAVGGFVESIWKKIESVGETKSPIPKVAGKPFEIKAPIPNPIALKTQIPEIGIQKKKTAPNITHNPVKERQENTTNVNTVVAPSNTTINNSKTSVIGHYALRNDDHSINKLLTSRDVAFSI